MLPTLGSTTPQRIILDLWVVSCLFYFHVMNVDADHFDDVSLVQTPANNSKLHFIRNETNSTSSILLFTQATHHHLDHTDDFQYFLCFQLFFHNHTDDTLTNETELKCHKSIPRYPFNISNLVNGTYLINSTLLLLSKSNELQMVKEELTMFFVIEMIDYHASYEWSEIEPYHSVINGLDVKMDISPNTTKKHSVKIPDEWVLQLFISSSYRLLWLLVSKSTALSSIISEVSKHTGVDYGCIDIVQNGTVLHHHHTVESMDWFYNKYTTFIALDPSAFCQPILCGFGFLNTRNISDQCGICDHVTVQYKALYAQNKGKMWIDVTDAVDFVSAILP
eukprot:698136_1